MNWDKVMYLHIMIFFISDRKKIRFWTKPIPKVLTTSLESLYCQEFSSNSDNSSISTIDIIVGVSMNISNNNRTHNKNNNYKKLRKKKNVVLDNRINSNVRKCPIRKRNTTVNQKLNDPLINTDTSFESNDPFENKYCSSSEWKLTSALDSTQKRYQNKKR